MKSVYLLLIVFIYLLSSCTEQPIVKDNKLSFGQSSCYLLDKDEFYHSVIDSTLLEKYFIFYNLNNIQMPINRVITRKKDTLFIAIATSESNIEHLKNAHKEEKTHNIIEQKQEEKMTSYFLKKDHFYNYRTFYKDSNSELIFLFNYISSDSSHIYDLYNSNDYVQKCINCEF